MAPVFRGVAVELFAEALRVAKAELAKLRTITNTEEN